MVDLRDLPSVDFLLNEQKILDAISQFGRSLVLDVIRQELEDIRKSSQNTSIIPEIEEIKSRILLKVNGQFSSTLIPVINATGVILHTNLGRSPLGSEVISEISKTSSAYSTVEYDIESGKRSSRSIHAEKFLKALTGAEAALVVNNNAAALFIILAALSKNKRVVVPRTQMVEIGGNFRIPDIMKQSGARLEEIGTTNQVHIEDYQEVLSTGCEVVLNTRKSNFKIIGFTSEPDLRELISLVKDSGVLIVEDLGSGALLNTETYGLEHEPTVREVISAGADIVCFSGDKLLGGPQAGIIVGKKQLIEKIKKHPLARVVRADKLCLAGLTATLKIYIKNQATAQIPVWMMISRTLEDIQCQAENWKNIFKMGDVCQGFSTVGGGSLPGEQLPTYLWKISCEHPNRMLKKLRQLPVPIIARIEDNKIIFDPRTVLTSQNDIFIDQVGSLFNHLR